MSVIQCRIERNDISIVRCTRVRRNAICECARSLRQDQEVRIPGSALTALLSCSWRRKTYQLSGGVVSAVRAHSNLPSYRIRVEQGPYNRVWDYWGWASWYWWQRGHWDHGRLRRRSNRKRRKENRRERKAKEEEAEKNQQSNLSPAAPSPSPCFLVGSRLYEHYYIHLTRPPPAHCTMSVILCHVMSWTTGSGA